VGELWAGNQVKILFPSNAILGQNVKGKKFSVDPPSSGKRGITNCYRMSDLTYGNYTIHQTFCGPTRLINGVFTGLTSGTLLLRFLKTM